MIYWDTSCVLKLYVDEPDSDVWSELAEQETAPFVSSALLDTEMTCALHARESRKFLKPGGADRLLALFRQDVERGRINLIPIGTDVLTKAGRLASECARLTNPIPVRTLDALHLATARVLKCSRIASADRQMLAIARHMGIYPLTV